MLPTNSASSNNPNRDPESLGSPQPYSRNQHDRTRLSGRWHHTLHPTVQLEPHHTRNALPKRIAHLVHPTHALLVHISGEPRPGLEAPGQSLHRGRTGVREANSIDDDGEAEAKLGEEEAIPKSTDSPRSRTSLTAYAQKKPGPGRHEPAGALAPRHKSQSHRRAQKWTSRNERKHRFVAISPTTFRRAKKKSTNASSKMNDSNEAEKRGGIPAAAEYEHRETMSTSTSRAASAKQSRHARNVAIGIWHMLVRIEYWNVSWWVAQLFTWGSVIWVINGFASLLPFAEPKHYETAFYSSGWTAFIGSTVFVVGSTMGLLEAWNREDVAGFGWSVREAVEGERLEGAGDVEAGRGVSDQRNDAQDAITSPSSPNDTPTPPSQSHTQEKAKALTNTSESSSLTFTGSLPQHLQKEWIWFSTDTKYFREIGFLAAFVQFWAALIFWISGFTALPTIQFALEKHPAALNGAFWSPQVVGGSGFIISSTFIMLETQSKWWKPNLTSLGWYVGFWNFVGGIGFTLCGALGYAATASHGAAYQSALSTFWGGWAFLIGSLLQWYESVNSVEQES